MAAPYRRGRSSAAQNGVVTNHGAASLAVGGDKWLGYSSMHLRSGCRSVTPTSHPDASRLGVSMSAPMARTRRGLSVATRPQSPSAQGIRWRRWSGGATLAEASAPTEASAEALDSGPRGRAARRRDGIRCALPRPRTGRIRPWSRRPVGMPWVPRFPRRQLYRLAAYGGHASPLRPRHRAVQHRPR